MGNYAFKYDNISKQIVAKGIERRIVNTENLMLVNVEFNDGPCISPDIQHKHPHEQVSYLVKGEVSLYVESDEPIHLKPGDCFAIPPNVQHSIQRLTQYVNIIDCFTPVREDFI